MRKKSVGRRPRESLCATTVLPLPRPDCMGRIVPCVMCVTRTTMRERERVFGFGDVEQARSATTVHTTSNRFSNTCREFRIKESIRSVIFGQTSVQRFLISSFVKKFTGYPSRLGVIMTGRTVTVFLDRFLKLSCIYN